jgi:hypothetical protein
MAEYVPVYDTTLHRWKLVALTDIAGSMTAVQIVQVLQAAFGRLTWLLSGNSVDGQPDTATAAAIAAFISQTGVAADYVDWIDLGASAGGGTFVIADATSGSFADNVALVLSHGVLAIADAYSASFADNVTLVDPEALVFVIADAYSASFSDVVTLARAGGELVIADAYSASSADNVTLVLSHGVFAIADAYSASSTDNVVLTSGASGNSFSETFDSNAAGWNLQAGTSMSGGDLVLTSGAQARINTAMTRGFYAEWDVFCDTTSEQPLFTVNTTAGAIRINGYGVGAYEGWDGDLETAVGVLILQRYASGTPTQLASFEAVPFNATTPRVKIRAEFASGGVITLKYSTNGGTSWTTAGTHTDNTYTSFAALGFFDQGATGSPQVGGVVVGAL